jgi:hypothetical protein
MTISLQDMRDVLKGQAKADQAIFWFGYFWNHGPADPLYKAMCETNYDPRLRVQQQIDTDPEIIYCMKMLMEQYIRAYGLPFESTMHSIPFKTIKEGDIVTHGPGRPFVCIEGDWPCKVFKENGELGVGCTEDNRTRYFHKFEILPSGHVKGFIR